MASQALASYNPPPLPHTPPPAHTSAPSSHHTNKKGLVKAKASNATPFLPFGARGAFNGASIVFFSYIGFDAVATAAGANEISV